MKFQLTVLMLALVLSGCAEHVARDRLGIEDVTVLKTGIASQDGAAGAATSQWVNTYAPIVSGKAAIAALQQRLDQAPGDKTNYFHAKAQCWIDAARQTSQTNDHWGFLEEAIGQAAMITMSLEKGTPLSAANPVLRTVSTVRPDLWQIVNTIKSDPAIAQCLPAQQPLACAEVELMQAGHDAWARSFVSAEKRLPEIKDNLRKSAETALQCAQAKPQPAVAESPQKITLRADSLFRFNGGNEAAILATGKPRLDAVAKGLEQVHGVGELRVTGFTDPLGTAAYNQRLSLQRAQTVKQYLLNKGVILPITAQGLGSANQVVACTQRKREDRVRCLAPNRRVEIEFVHAAP
ncbi:OmpA family protein [Paraburkholderia fungorum]|uniref:OmpA family protein n=1 Tax=Paraburkholderia fungorum TaxID=134537 RepID=UPI0004AA1F21|nr:OmpA family protein [Paraburkholderia fungorum]KFX62667.1 flagellar motor protein MotB [Burkholderia sp. K24]USX05145.1 OmpA family protein [Paraburkholderia fungorum]